MLGEKPRVSLDCNKFRSQVLNKWEIVPQASPDSLSVTEPGVTAESESNNMSEPEVKTPVKKWEGKQASRGFTSVYRR